MRQGAAARPDRRRARARTLRPSRGLSNESSADAAASGAGAHSASRFMLARSASAGRRSTPMFASAPAHRGTLPGTASSARRPHPAESRRSSRCSPISRLLDAPRAGCRLARSRRGSRRVGVTGSARSRAEHGEAGRRSGGPAHDRAEPAARAAAARDLPSRSTGGPNGCTADGANRQQPLTGGPRRRGDDATEHPTRTNSGASGSRSARRAALRGQRRRSTAWRGRHAAKSPGSTQHRAGIGLRQGAGGGAPACSRPRGSARFVEAPRASSSPALVAAPAPPRAPTARAPACVVTPYYDDLVHGPHILRLAELHGSAPGRRARHVHLPLVGVVGAVRAAQA